MVLQLLTASEYAETIMLLFSSGRGEAAEGRGGKEGYWREEVKIGWAEMCTVGEHFEWTQEIMF